VARRSYPHPCSLAQALDIVGERWTLLLVHELLVGPQRFKDLLDALAAMGPKLLAQRLRTLEDEGVVARRVLPPPAGSTVYELTPLGQQLRSAVVALYRWGVELTTGSTGDGGAVSPAEARAGTPLRCGIFDLQHVNFRPDRAAGVHDTYEFRVDGEVFHIEVADGRVTSRLGPAPAPDATFTMDAGTFLADDYEEAAVTGDPEAARRALEVLGRTRRSPA